MPSEQVIENIWLIGPDVEYFSWEIIDSTTVPPTIATTLPHTIAPTDDGKAKLARISLKLFNDEHKIDVFETAVISVTKSDNYSIGGDFQPATWWFDGAVDTQKCIEYFPPNANGKYHRDISTLIVIAKIKAEVIGLTTTPNSIHFGDLTPETAQRTDSIIIKNENSESTTIISAKWQNGNNFTLDTPLEGLQMAPMDSIFAKISLNTTKVGVVTDTLIVVGDYATCGLCEIKIPVSATINTPTHYNIKVSDNYNVPTNQRNFAIPINITSFSNAVSNSIEKLTLTMNKQLFRPRTVTEGTMSMFYFGDSLEITLTDIPVPPLEANNTTILSSIKGDILLGNTDYTDIFLNELQIEGAEQVATHSTENGSLSVDICSAGSDRLLDIFAENPGVFVLENPADGMLKVRCFCAERGDYVLNVTDAVGNTVTNLHQWNVVPFQQREFEFEFSLTNLSNGNYYISMETPTKRYYNRFVVGR